MSDADDQGLPSPAIGDLCRLLSCLFFTEMVTLYVPRMGVFDKNKTNIWLESYSTLIYYVGFALFPFVLFLVYFDLNLTNLVIIGLIILIFTKILMFYKWVKLFFIN